MKRDTVFSPSFGNRPSYLVGRDEVIEDFLAGLKSAPGSRDRALLLLGQRGTGKTVLLWELVDRASELGFVVASPTMVSETMLDRIVEKVQEAGARYAGDAPSRLSGGSVGAFGFTVGLEFTREVQEGKTAQFRLTQLARRLTRAGHGVLILVDELQANAPEVRELVSVYQEMVGEQLNVALVMAGLPGAVSATLNDRVLTFLNRATKISLSPLREGDVDAFFAYAFDRLEIRLGDEGRLRATRFTQGSPYMLQLVGHNIVLAADDSGAISEEALSRALKRSRRDFENDVCETTLRALSEKDVEFLTAMSRDDGPSRVTDVAERMDVSADYAQKYRRRLIDAGVVESPTRGRLAFAVPYLRDWLQSKR